jgi:uncharacterized RDD family membrane protein YckC
VPDAETAVRPAGLFRRLAALLYDFLLVLSLLMLATLAVLPFTGGKAILHNPFYNAYLVILIFLYFGWHWVGAGQTLGMRAWHLRLTAAGGGPISWRQALVRFLAAIPAGLLGGLGYLWILFSREKLAWHDWASDTCMVVAKPRKRKAVRREGAED